MDLHQADQLARTLIATMLPPEWRLEWDRARKRFGQCVHQRKVIKLSAPLVHLNKIEDVSDTIRHEIAHALVGGNHGHDWTWQQMAVKCGAKPQRCYHYEVVRPQLPWVAACCGRTWQRGKRPNSRYRYWCPVCKATIVWQHRGISAHKMQVDCQIIDPTEDQS